MYIPLIFEPNMKKFCLKTKNGKMQFTCKQEKVENFKSIVIFLEGLTFFSHW